MNYHKKLKHEIVSEALLGARERRAHQNGFPTARWITFCRDLIRLGFTLSLYEARQSHSQYFTIRRPASHRRFRVRFSDHLPAFERQVAKDCDFFVGYSHSGMTTNADAIAAVLDHFKAEENLQ